MGEPSKPNGDVNGIAHAVPMKRGRVAYLAGEEKKATRRRSSMGIVSKNSIPQPPRKSTGRLLVWLLPPSAVSLIAYFATSSTIKTAQSVIDFRDRRYGTIRPRSG